MKEFVFPVIVLQVKDNIHLQVIVFQLQTTCLPDSGDVHVATSCRLVPDPSNLVMANTPELEPGWLMMVSVCPMMLTGTLMEKASSHSQVWFFRTSDDAATSCPSSQTLNVTSRASPLGNRRFMSSNLE